VLNRLGAARAARALSGMRAPRGVGAFPRRIERSRLAGALS